MVEDNEKHGSVHLDGYNRSWEVSVRRRHDFVVLGRGWKKFVRDVIQDYEKACIVFEYKGYMSFTVRAFYDDGNIVVDVPLNMSHLSQECLGGFSGPGPEFLMPITSVAGRPMVIFPNTFTCLFFVVFLLSFLPCSYSLFGDFYRSMLTDHSIEDL